MIIRKIDLYDYFHLQRKEGADGYLTTYVHTTATEGKRPAMVVIGGGGYAGISDREQEPIALAYVVEGYNAFVLQYSVAPNRYPTALIEAAMAVAYLRKNAEKWNIDSEEIAVVGFSAGGHLTSSLGSLYNEECVQAALGENGKLCKPNAVVLAYPVITSGVYTHNGTMENLLGEKCKDEEMLKTVSLEKRVHLGSAPAFIWCTVDDEVVHSENSLMLAQAYKKAGVLFELHIFATGIHGMALATKETNTLGTSTVSPSVEKWVELSILWMKSHVFHK